MKLTHEQQRFIAQKILQAYHVVPPVSNAFRKGTKNHRLFYSEYQGEFFPATLYWLENEPSYLAEAKRFEEETGCLVFHVILSHSNFGDCLDFLFVPADSEDVEMFLNEAFKCRFVSRCHNLTYDEVEMGTIEVRPAMGGMCRTA